MALRRLGDILYELVNESGQFCPDDEENPVRPALLAIARDLLPEASTPPEIADKWGWNRDLPEEEALLASRIEAWAVHVQLLARSICVTLGEEFGESLEVAPECLLEGAIRPVIETLERASQVTEEDLRRKFRSGSATSP